MFQANISAWCSCLPYQWLSVTALAQPKTRLMPTQPTMHCSTWRSWQRKCNANIMREPYRHPILVDVTVMSLMIPLHFRPVLLVKPPSQRQLIMLRQTPQILGACPLLIFYTHTLQFEFVFPRTLPCMIRQRIGKCETSINVFYDYSWWNKIMNLLKMSPEMLIRHRLLCDLFFGKFLSVSVSSICICVKFCFNKEIKWCKQQSS